MDASADHPQIGRLTVERAALDEPGTKFDDVLGSLGIDVTIEGVPEGTPSVGWRVLARPEYAVVLGSPVDDGSRWWHIAQVAPPRAGSPAHVRVHPEPQPLRPSRAERGRGLVLRWPEVTRSEPDLDQLAVDVVNTGAERWRPDGDSFRAIGFIARPSGTLGDFYLGFVGGGPSAFALDPGEYARVPVHLDASQWKDLEAGRHEISATLMDLGVRTETPLEVELTAEQIEQHQPPPDRAPRSTPDHRHERERLEGVRALLAANNDLGAVLDVVTAAASDNDARRGIQDLLGCSPDAAHVVYEMQLRRFRPESIRRFAEEAAELERRIEHSASGEASAR